jgi:ribose transport system substrate-binding protein
MCKTVRLVIAALLAASLLLGAGCRKTERLRIAVVPKAQTLLFWETVRAGALAAGDEFGVEILWSGPPTEIDFTRQINIVEDFLNQRVDGIALAPAHGVSLVPVVERAFQEKVPVTIFDSGIQTEKYLSYVSTDNYSGGASAARRMGEVLPQGRTIAIIGTIPGSVSTGEREKGFRETIAREFPALQVVEFQYGMSDPARSRAVAADILAAHSDLGGMFCSNESGTLGAVRAATALGLTGRLKIVGFDVMNELVNDVRSGSVDSLVVQNPFRMGYLAVRSLVDGIRGNPPAKRIDTGATVVTLSNIDTPEIRQLLHPPVAARAR